MAKAGILDTVVQEYTQNGAGLIKGIEKLHEKEQRELQESIEKRRQEYIKACEEGSQECDKLLEELKRINLTKRMEEVAPDYKKMIENGKGMTKRIEEEIAKMGEIDLNDGDDVMEL